MALASLKRPKEEKRPEIGPSYMDRENSGARVELEHHHLMAMKGRDGKPIAGKLQHGQRVHFRGMGEVERASTHSDERGDHHSATLRIHRAEVEPRGKADGAPKYPKEMVNYLKERG